MGFAEEGGEGVCEDEMVQSPSDGDSPAPGTRELGQRARREAPRLSAAPPTPAGLVPPSPRLAASRYTDGKMERKEGGDTHAWVTARTTGDPGGDPRAAPSGDTEGAFAPWL